MYVIEVGPIKDNPQTNYKVVFGNDVSLSKVLDRLKQAAQLREQSGLTTEANTIETLKEAESKLLALNIFPL